MLSLPSLSVGKDPYVTADIKYRLGYIWERIDFMYRTSGKSWQQRKKRKCVALLIRSLRGDKIM